MGGLARLKRGLRLGSFMEDSTQESSTVPEELSCDGQSATNPRVSFEPASQLLLSAAQIRFARTAFA
jgi:hypothetical protein